MISNAQLLLAAQAAFSLWRMFTALPSIWRVTPHPIALSRMKPPLPVQAGFNLWRTFTALPWHVVPFLFGMFIMVEALNRGGWVDYFGRVRRTIVM